MAAILGSVLLVLTLAASAGAECAWVLWEKLELKTPAPSEASWSLHSASVSRPLCEKALTRLWQVRVETNKPGPLAPGIEETTAAPGLVSVRWKQGGGSTTTFYCLPDTIDPRGPTGSK